MKDVERAIEINPDWSWAIGYRGEIYLWLHRYEEALEIFNQQLETNPESDWTYYLRALATLQTPGVLETPGISAATDLTQAIQLAQTDHDKDPSNWYNHFNLALYHLAAGHHSEAATLYETGLETAPAWAIGMAHRDLRDYLHILPGDEAAKGWSQRLGEAVQPSREVSSNPTPLGDESQSGAVSPQPQALK